MIWYERLREGDERLSDSEFLGELLPLIRFRGLAVYSSMWDTIRKAMVFHTVGFVGTGVCYQKVFTRSQRDKENLSGCSDSNYRARSDLSDSSDRNYRTKELPLSCWRISWVPKSCLFFYKVMRWDGVGKVVFWGVKKIFLRCEKLKNGDKWGG